MAREARYLRVRRIVELTRRLVGAPGRLFSLSELGQLTRAARSTLSEDVGLIDETLRSAGLGAVDTVSGAAGGVRYIEQMGPDAARAFVEQLMVELSDADRIIPGGFLYMTDVIFSPSWSEQIGTLFATRFASDRPQIVLTMETKGIPLALMTARAMGIPLAVARRESRVTEGSAVGLNYVSSSGRIGTMSLGRRTLSSGARVLLVDDFLKGGSTVRGLVDLALEFGAEVVGAAALCETPASRERLIARCFSLISLEQVDESARAVHLRPSPSFAEYLREATAEHG